MRVMVTGASGFVGSEVVLRLVAEGHAVTAVDRDPAALRRLAEKAPDISPVAFDLAGRESLAALLTEARPERLIHLAWYADPVDYLTAYANVASLEMTVALVQAALSVGCRRIVGGGSCAEYAFGGPAAGRERPRGTTDPLRGVQDRRLPDRARHGQKCRRAVHLDADVPHPRTGRKSAPLTAVGRAAIEVGSPVPLTDGTQVRDHLHVTRRSLSAHDHRRSRNVGRLQRLLRGTGDAEARTGNAWAISSGGPVSFGSATCRIGRARPCF